MNVYHDKAQLIYKGALESNRIDNLPKSMIDGSFVLYKPKVKYFDYQKASKPLSLYEFWSSYRGKKVFYNDKEVTLQALSHSDALIELPSKKLATVSIKELLFPSQKNLYVQNSKHIIFPKKVVGSVVHYSYLLRDIKWQSNYRLKLQKGAKARLQGNFEIANNTKKTFRLDCLRLIAGKERMQHPPKPYYRSKMAVSMAAAPAADTDTKAIENYYGYTFKKSVELPAKTKRSIPFLDKSVTLTKRYHVTLANPKYFSGSAKHTPQFEVAFSVPLELPFGSITFFDGAGNYLGDSTLSGTPKGEKVSLVVGEDFFSKVKERLLRYKRHKESFEAEVEYTIHNASKEKRGYELIVPLREAASCSVTTSQPYRLKNANALLFEVTLPPMKRKKFTVLYQRK